MGRMLGCLRGFWEFDAGFFVCMFLRWERGVLWKWDFEFWEIKAVGLAIRVWKNAWFEFCDGHGMNEGYYWAIKFSSF